MLTIAEVKSVISKIRKLVSEGYIHIVNRDKNNNLILEYIFPETKINDIIMSLEVEDFSHTKESDKEWNKGGILYVFGKNVGLLQRYGYEFEIVELYIKIDIVREEKVVVVSFHKQESKLMFPYKTN